jgi:uncharacterized protein
LPLIVILLLAAAGAVCAVDLSSVPKPTGYVSDLANVFDASDKQALESFCTKVDQQLGAQFAIVTINTLGDTPIENFSLELFRKWGVGPKGKNEGLMLLLVIQDRKQRIEVGRGLEPYITDADAGTTMRDMRDLLRQSNYGGAAMQGARSLAARIAAGKNISFSDAAAPAREQRQQPQQDTGGGIPIPLIVFGAIFLLFFILSRRGGGFGGGSGGGGGFGGFGGGDSGGGGASSDW